ncbi:hypothetical protein RB213_010303 [Colletotrichum asianum]
MTIARRLRLADIDDPVQHFEVAKSKMDPLAAVTASANAAADTKFMSTAFITRGTAYPKHL